MRKFFLSSGLALFVLATVAIASADARPRWRRGGYVSDYYYPAYSYSYSAPSTVYYPDTTTYVAPQYDYSYAPSTTYYSPGYSSYYSPGYYSPGYYSSGYYSPSYYRGYYGSGYYR